MPPPAPILGPSRSGSAVASHPRRTQACLAGDLMELHAVLPERACLERQLGSLEIVDELDAGSSTHASRPDSDGLPSRSDDDDLFSTQDIEKGDQRTRESTNQERYGSHTLAGELEGPKPHNRRQDQQHRV